jgi:hypothetical protein
MESQVVASCRGETEGNDVGRAENDDGDWDKNWVPKMVLKEKMIVLILSSFGSRFGTAWHRLVAWRKTPNKSPMITPISKTITRTAKASNLLLRSIISHSVRVVRQHAARLLIKWGWDSAVVHLFWDFEILCAEDVKTMMTVASCRLMENHAHAARRLRPLHMCALHNSLEMMLVIDVESNKDLHANAVSFCYILNACTFVTCWIHHWEYRELETCLNRQMWDVGSTWLSPVMW